MRKLPPRATITAIREDTPAMDPRTVATCDCCDDSSREARSPVTLGDFLFPRRSFPHPLTRAMVPRRGLEPPRPCERQHLKVGGLPIPPPGHLSLLAGRGA